MIKKTIFGHNIQWRDIMNSKKIYIYSSVFIFLLIVSFLCAFLLTEESIKKENQDKAAKSTETVAIDNINKNISKEPVITKTTSIVFKIEYQKSGEIEIEKKDFDINSLLGKSQKGIEEIYGIDGYIVDKMDNNELILIKKLDRYSPNKYVLDIYREGDCLGIFKTDSEGKETIEDPDNDIKFETKISDVKEGDLLTLTQGRKILQFDSKEEAEEYYQITFKS